MIQLSARRCTGEKCPHEVINYERSAARVLLAEAKDRHMDNIDISKFKHARTLDSIYPS